MATKVERRTIIVRGFVQGVGFRPFVYRLAAENRLHGFVRNRTDGVHIEVQGDELRLDRFLEGVRSHQPPLARIESIDWRQCPLEEGEGFEICDSQRVERGTFMPPDVATCDDCFREMFDPANRRYLYPFISCTNCGPRFTIVTGLPYDRARTTMSWFEMCAECRAEYENPADRRFHAQPTACPDCGPHVALLDGDGKQITAKDPIALAAEFIRDGKIIGLKGLGGFHLVCDASSEAAVGELRRRKERDEKPFAIMVADIAYAEALCVLNSDEKALLLAPERPIVLLRRRTGKKIASAVAPGNPHLGVMLPYTPLHHLLVREIKTVPLVMTSGNRSDEPMVFQDRDLVPKLRGIADFFLTHDRAIHFRCDDTVVSKVGKNPMFLRRSRGYAPASLTLSVKCRVPVLAAGGQLKATFVLGREGHAIISHHLGDLDEYSALVEYERSIEHYENVFEFTPEVLAHDLHPDYASTRYCQNRAGRFRRLAVQHHHAHMASCMAEHGLNERVIGVIFDGTGYGPDGTVWGGEFLVGDYRAYQRAAHLRCVRMPGGEGAVREPWRMGMAHLMDAGLDAADVLTGISRETLNRVEACMRQGINAPAASSCGRLFDAVAALLGVRSRTTYEGQAAMELEWLATEVEADESLPFAVQDGEPLVVDTRPVITAVVEARRRGVAERKIARRLHFTVARIIGTVCERLREKAGINQVVLSGGVFMNRILLEDANRELWRRKFEVYCHRDVPPNDGGLSLGQAVVAAAQHEDQN